MGRKQESELQKAEGIRQKMGRVIGIIVAGLPFVLAWTAPLLVAAGYEALAQRIASIAFFQVVAWIGLTLGGFIAVLNVFLSFGRPLILRAWGIAFEDQRFVSGFPMIGSVLLMFASIPCFPHIWPCMVVTVLLLLDTGGPLWFLICTWKDGSFWTKQRNSNNKPGERV